MLCAFAVDDHGQRVHGLVIHADLQLDQIIFAVAVELVIKGRVALGDGFQAVVEIEHNLVQRQAVDQHGAVAGIGEVELHAAAVLAELEQPAEIFIGDEDGGLDPRFLYGVDLDNVGHVDGVVELDLAAVGHVDFVDHGRRGGDEVEVEFALQPLLYDLHMQQAEEAATETEAKGLRAFHLVVQGGIVEADLAKGLLKLFEFAGVGRVEGAEHHRDGGLKAGQGLRAGLFLIRDRVADIGLADVLDGGGDESHLAGAELLQLNFFRGEHADAVDIAGCAVGHEFDLLPFFKIAINDADQHHHAEINVIPGIDEEGLCGGVRVALMRRRELGDDGFEQVVDTRTGFGGGEDGFRGVEADNIFDLCADLFRVGGGQVDLVDDRHDFMIVVESLIHIGQRLRLHTLRRIHNEQGALTGGQRAGDLVAEIHMARRVHKVELIFNAVPGLIGEAHGLGLDGDAALALDVRVVEDLLAHLALIQPAAGLDQAVGQCRLAVIDMRDDREVSYVFQWFAHPERDTGVAYLFQAKLLYTAFMSEEEKKEFNLAAFLQGPVFMLILICVPICFALLNLLLAKPEGEAPQPVAVAQEESVAPGRRLYAEQKEASYPVISAAQSQACDFQSWVGRPYSMEALRGLDRPYRFLVPGASGLKVENPARVNLEVDDRGTIIRIWCG